MSYMMGTKEHSNKPVHYFDMFICHIISIDNLIHNRKTLILLTHKTLEGERDREI